MYTDSYLHRRKGVVSDSATSLCYSLLVYAEPGATCGHLFPTAASTSNEASMFSDQHP